MIWHVVRFDMSALDETVRRELESSLQGLAALEDVAWLRVAPDIDDPGVTGLLTAFRDHAALERYRVDPDHRAFLDRLRAFEVPAVRLDVATDDDVDALP